MLALNIASRSFLRLLDPLNHDQFAPILFLWLERLAILVGGVNEFSLRAAPLVAGIALLVATWRVSARLLGTQEALVAVAIAVFCPALIFYSNEVKPYGIEALITLLLVHLAVNAREESGFGTASWGLLVAGVVAVWASTAVVFVLVGVAVSLVIAGREHGVRTLQKAVFLLAAWCPSALAAYLLSYRRAALSPYMRQFWERTFLEAPTSWEAVLHSWVLLFRASAGVFLGASSVLDHWGGLEAVVLVAGAGIPCLILLGALRITRTRGTWVTSLLLAPFALMAAASLFGLYPISARTLLFTVPLLIILAATGLSWCVDLLPVRWRALGAASGAAISLGGLPVDGQWVIRRVQWNDAGDLIRTLQQENQGTEPIYINARGVPIWAFYTTDWARPDTLRLHTLVRLTEFSGPAFENAATRGRPVTDQGTGLVLDRQGSELVGLPTGMQLRSWAGLIPTQPDSNWARNEVARLRAAARPRVWLCFFYDVDSSRLLLIRELEREGGRQLRALVAREAFAYQYDFGQIRATAGRETSLSATRD